MVSKQYHIAYGIHSGIPSCCIIFFINEWDKKELWRKEKSELVKAIRDSGAGYVMCPKCLASNSIVNIRDCAQECKRECWKYY